MASISKLQTTADGRRFWKISVSRGYGKTPYTTRFYWPPEWSKTDAESKLKRFAAEYETKCNNGEIKNREERREIEEAQKAEAAKLKTLRQYAKNVWFAAKQIDLSENGRASYEMYLDKHILPELGDCLIRDISPAMVNALIQKFRADHAHASTVKLYNILHAIFDMAAKDDSIEYSPMLKVDRPGPRADEVPKEESEKAYTAEEMSYILSCLDNESLKWRAYVYVMADTWMRRGEVCGLQWSDIDFKNNVITVRHNLQYSPSKGVFDKRPKNKKARPVDVDPAIISMLKTLREEQSQSCISKWVFSQDGVADPMHPQRPTKFFKKLEKRYGIADFHPHKLRHSGISISVRAGADVASVAVRAGHSNPSVTTKLYTHPDAEGPRRAGELNRAAVKKAGQMKEEKNA